MWPTSATLNALARAVGTDRRTVQKRHRRLLYSWIMQNVYRLDRGALVIDSRAKLDLPSKGHSKRCRFEAYWTVKVVQCKSRMLDLFIGKAYLCLGFVAL